MLILAGGGSYYFAKRSINADREERAAAEERRRQVQQELQAHEAILRERAMAEGRAKSGANGGATADVEPSKYETSTPFRSKKGDRFS